MDTYVETVAGENVTIYVYPEGNPLEPRGHRAIVHLEDPVGHALWDRPLRPNPQTIQIKDVIIADAYAQVLTPEAYYSVVSGGKDAPRAKDSNTEVVKQLVVLLNQAVSEKKSVENVYG